MGAEEALLYVFILFATSTTLVFYFILFYYKSDGHISGILSSQTLSVGYILPFRHTVLLFIYFANFLCNVETLSSDLTAKTRCTSLGITDIWGRWK